MKLNIKKTNNMIINFSTKYQFNTRFSIERNKVEKISETKLLGLKIRDDLSWHSSITKGKKNDLERTKKIALRIIFGTAYTAYLDILEWAGLDTLAARRTKFCLNFAKIKELDPCFQ